MEKEEFIYAVIVCKDNESDFIYNESINFLSKLYLKSISLNIVISSVEDYGNLIQKNYNKVIYSEKEKQVVYSDSSCKPLVSIINYSKEDEKYSKKHMSSASCIDDIHVQAFIEDGIIKDDKTRKVFIYNGIIIK